MSRHNSTLPNPNTPSIQQKADFRVGVFVTRVGFCVGRRRIALKNQVRRRNPNGETADIADEVLRSLNVAVIQHSKSLYCLVFGGTVPTLLPAEVQRDRREEAGLLRDQQSVQVLG